MHKIRCWFDGACSPENPGGNMGIGVVIDLGDEVIEISECIGKNGGNSSSNLAEYHAVGNLLLWLLANVDWKTDIQILGDSRLVSNQLNDFWNISRHKIYSKKAVEVYETFKNLKSKYKSLEIDWIPRKENKRADELSKEGISKCKNNKYGK